MPRLDGFALLNSRLACLKTTEQNDDYCFVGLAKWRNNVFPYVWPVCKDVNAKGWEKFIYYISQQIWKSFECQLAIPYCSPHEYIEGNHVQEICKLKTLHANGRVQLIWARVWADLLIAGDGQHSLNCFQLGENGRLKLTHCSMT